MLAAGGGGADQGRDSRLEPVRWGSPPGTSRRWPASPRAFPTARRSPRNGWSRSPALSRTCERLGSGTSASATTGDMARLEVSAEEQHRFQDPAFRERINRALRALGFNFVALDLEPFRSGRLNEAVGQGRPELPPESGRARSCAPQLGCGGARTVGAPCALQQASPWCGAEPGRWRALRRFQQASPLGLPPTHPGAGSGPPPLDGGARAGPPS